MNKEIKEAKDEGQGLVQMYQAGFLDGVKFCRKNPFIFTKHQLESSDKKSFLLVSEACKKAFEVRFIKKIQKNLNKNGSE